MGLRAPLGFLARRPSDGVASSVTARLAAPSSRLVRRTPRQETARGARLDCVYFVGHSPPGCSLLPPCQTNASPGNRSRRPSDGVASSLLRRGCAPNPRCRSRGPEAPRRARGARIVARLAPSSRLVRRTPREETARGARLDGVAPRSQPGRARARPAGAAWGPTSARGGFGAQSRMNKAASCWVR